MNVPHILNEMELAIYELSEAESHERRASALRLKAGKRLSACHLATKSAFENALEIRRDEHRQKPSVPSPERPGRGTRSGI